MPEYNPYLLLIEGDIMFMDALLARGCIFVQKPLNGLALEYRLGNNLWNVFFCYTVVKYVIGADHHDGAVLAKTATARPFNDDFLFRFLCSDLISKGFPYILASVC